MPRAVDRRQLPIDRNPLWSIMGGGVGNLPKLDAQQLWQGWLTAFKTFTGIDLSSPEALVASLGSMIGGALDPAQLIATLSKVFGYVGPPLPSLEALAAWVGQSLFGLIDPSRLPQIPLGSIVQDSPNLLPNGSFTGAIAIDDTTGRWVIDNAVYHGTEPGSARTTANGTIAELLSIDSIPVKPGQKLDVGGFIRWAGLVASNDSLAIGLMEYGSAGENRVLVKSVGAASGTSDWQQFTGQYVVPATGVSSVRVRLVVNEGATAGTVNFDDLSAGLGANLLPVAAVEGLGAQLSQAFDTAEAAAQQFLTFLSGQWQTLLNGVTGDVGGAVEDLLDRLQHLKPGGLFDAANLTNVTSMPPIGQGQVDGLVGDLGGIIDNAVKGAGNLLGSGFGLPDLFDALRGMQSNIADANAALAALQADQSSNTGTAGKKILVNVGDWPNSATPPTVFTKIRDTGAGSVATVSGALEWQDSGSAAEQEFYLYNADTLLSDYFEVAFVMPRRPEDEGPFGVFAPPYNYLLGRVSSDGQSFCFARVGFSRISIGCVVNGTTTMLGNEIGFAAPAGALVRFRGGTTGGVRIFQVQVNSQVVGSATDSGNVSMLGSGYRNVGLGFEAQPRGSGQGTPGNVTVFAANDNAPADIVGSTARFYRSSTTGISKPVGDAVLPASCFDTVDYKSPDLTWDAATQKVTVSRSGTYLVAMRVQCSAIIDMGEEWSCLLYKNGTLQSRGDGFKGDFPTSTSNDNENGPTFVGGAPMLVYLTAGQYVQFGFGNSSGSESIVGDAGGTKTWAAITRVGGLA